MRQAYQGLGAILRMEKEDFYTIARGATPEDAFWFAQNSGGLNGKEILKKEAFEVYEVPNDQTPFQFAFGILNKPEFKIDPMKVACVQIRKADPKAPRENYFISKRINAYLFFGYAV